MRGKFDAAVDKGRTRSGRERSINGGVGHAIKPRAVCKPRVQPEQVPRQAQMLDAPLARVLHQNGKYDRVQMHVQMAINVIEFKSGCLEAVKLRCNLGLKLCAKLAAKKILHPGIHRTVRKFATFIYETGDPLARQRGATAEQREVQSHAELWIFFGQRDGFIARQFIHHQAGGRKDAFAMRADNGFVD